MRWYWSDIPPFVRLITLYRRAVDNGPPWRLSSVCGVSAGFLPPCGVLLAHYYPALVLVRRGVCGSVLLALYCPAVVMVRRCVYRPSVVSCWRSIALRLIMVCRGVCRPFLRFVRLLAFYRRAVFCWLTIAVRLIMVRPGVCRSFLLVLLFL